MLGHGTKPVTKDIGLFKIPYGKKFFCSLFWQSLGDILTPRRIVKSKRMGRSQEQGTPCPGRNVCLEIFQV
jgi:hypothetical protein